MLHHLGFQTSKGTEDYLYYFLLVVLTPINCFLNGTLLSLSAFLTGIIMHQQAPPGTKQGIFCLLP